MLSLMLNIPDEQKYQKWKGVMNLMGAKKKISLPMKKISTDRIQTIYSQQELEFLPD